MVYYTEIFRTEIRIRFFGNCNKTKDIVFNFNKEIPTDIVHNLKIHLNVYKHEFILDYYDSHEKEGSLDTFNKFIFEKSIVKNSHGKIAIDNKAENNLIISTRLSSL